MHGFSVKLRITLWYSMMLILLTCLVEGLMLILSTRVVVQSSLEQLEQALRANLPYVKIENNRLALDPAFSFFQNGVHSLVYSESEALLAGQVPVALSNLSEPFQNGKTRVVRTEQGAYYVKDFWVQTDWTHGVWVRGLLTVPESRTTMRNLLAVSAVVLPLFVLLSALGGWFITCRAFRPLNTITAAATTIGQSGDLSERIPIAGGRDEFSRLAGVFNWMFARLERSFEAEKRFTSDASHELRTPVSVILGACNVAKKYDESPEDYHETIAMIERQGAKMSILIEQLLRMTRLDQGTEALSSARLDLRDIVQSVRTDAAYQPYTMVCTLPPSPVFVMGDALLLTRLLQNLIDNAVKYGSPDQGLTIDLESTASHARLSVIDHGEGIAIDEQAKIWQRFYRIDASRSDGTGTGLGLCMVQQIAALHGGTMQLQSAPGQGCCFTLQLPLASQSQ